MRTRRWVCLAVLLLGGMAAVPGAGKVHADPYPLQGKAFVQDGTVEKVDGDRDRVIFRGDDGQRCTLDTSDSEITLPDGNRAGTTPDLSPGMRVHVSGRLLSVNIAEVSQLRVLSLPRLTHPVGPPLPAPADDPNAITLRGTVDKIDTRQGTFVVKVKDHTRTILLADDTDLSGLGKISPQDFPVKAGDRVTIAGALQPDGSVLAGAVSYSRDIAFPPRTPVSTDHLLIGRISAQSDRYSHRDIKIRLANDREIKIKVPRGIPIRRDGQSVSVHDLRGGEPVRVTGGYDGGAFKATRIEALSAADPPVPGGLSRL